MICKLIKWVGILSIALITCINSSVQGKEQIMNSVRDSLKSQLYSKGLCTSPERSIDLDDTFFLQNIAVQLPQEKNPTWVEIQGESIRLTRNGEKGIETERIDLELEISRHYGISDSLDISPTFIFLDGEIAVHWRQTFQHQRYKQGVFKLKRGNIVWECDGVSGVNKSY